MPSYVVHYSEIGIKGDNRILFEKQLIQNIRARLGEPSLVVRREFGRLVLEDVVASAERVEERLARTPGIAYFASVSRLPLALEGFAPEALRLSQDLGAARSFRIDTRRSNKSFPATSIEVNRLVGGAVAQATGLRVDLERPDHVVWIEIAQHEALFYTRRVAGPSGLPVGVSGSVVALVSGGIDSPVAAYKLIRRGCRTVLVHFHNYTRDEARVRAKLMDMARVLARYQHTTRLYLVPFEAMQSALVAAVKAPQRMVAYRRMMLRLATSILEREGAKAFVTGDSVGQVASQTLDNLLAIHAAASHPVLSPLIGDDKNDIVDVARQIGSFDVSIRPYEDCCSFLVARHPDTRVSLEHLALAEARIPYEALAKQCLDAAEQHDLTDA